MVLTDPEEVLDCSFVARADGSKRWADGGQPFFQAVQGR
jgi:predicted lipoprotein with Yx(FWY)xxD motif